ncbi:AAA family ATPase [Rhodopseudomonas palustris]|uniref:AAA family ATPase n=1 Tax=Rhodopseudomonas palustris TaxID=1076 RepID=UPI0009B66EA1
MKLTSFQVQNFRSIEDSGWINVDNLTSLVGRNESGKSNLLLALASLNPPGKRAALNPVKDFPRSRRLEDCKNNTVVVWAWWDLSDDEAAELKPLLGPITKVAVGRGYGADAIWTDFQTREASSGHKEDVWCSQTIKTCLGTEMECTRGGAKNQLRESVGCVRESKR